MEENTRKVNSRGEQDRRRERSSVQAPLPHCSAPVGVVRWRGAAVWQRGELPNAAEEARALGFAAKAAAAG
jgi:hypothetical protein